MLNQGVGSWIHRRRVKSAGRKALISHGMELTYDELADRIDRLANALRDRGVNQGDRVAYLGNNDTAFLETFFACGTLGAIFVPLNTRLAPPEITYALNDSGSVILIHEDGLGHLAREGAPGTPVTHRMVVGDPDDDKGVRIAPDLSDGAEDYDVVVTASSPEHINVPVTYDDPAMILYTSGTTGRPKGALLTHGNMAFNSFNVLIDHDMSFNDVALMIAPLFHVAALGQGVIPTLLKGATVILERRFEPGRALALIEKYKATYISGVPTTYQMLAEHPAWDTTDISSLRKLTCGGSSVPTRILDAYEKRGLSFTQGYGMTETAPGATQLYAEKTREKMGSVGLPQHLTDVRIVGGDNSILPPGEVGEIQISGPNVIREYWNRPEATADSFADGDWFRSGDMGYKDNEGYVYIADRLKDMIISGGENIYPAEVEQLIMELDAVDSVAVIGIPDEKWGEVPRAIITLKAGRELTESAVVEHLNNRIARYKIPKSAVFIEEFPRTASGKIRKADLRRQYSD